MIPLTTQNEQIPTLLAAPKTRPGATPGDLHGLRIHYARCIVSHLRPGQALIYKFDSKVALRRWQRLFYTGAYPVSTATEGLDLYVWLRDQTPRPPVETVLED